MADDQGQQSDQGKQAQQGDQHKPGQDQTAAQGDHGKSQPQGQQTHDDAAQQTDTAGKQPGGFRVELTDEQRKALLEGKPLQLSDEQYTGGVRSQMATLKQRATAAENHLAKIAAAQEESERKALVEQEKFKELYEQEKEAREKLSSARQTDLIRASFQLAAAKANVVDPESAFLIAKSLPGFAEVTVSGEGAVSGIDELLKFLIESKPYLVSSQHKPQSVGGASNPSSSESPPPKTLAEAGDQLEQKLRSGQA